MTSSKTWASLGMLILGAEYAQANVFHDKPHSYSDYDPGHYDSSSTLNSTSTTTKTVYHTKSKPSVVTYSPVSSPPCENSTVTVTITPTTPTVTITPTPTSTYNPCPTTCTVSADTVNVFFWPTNEPFTYPPTYFDASLDYTFTSPSVYLIINTIQGYNSLGPTPPSASRTIFPLDLDEVSTIDLDTGATRQLTLSDLGTDCPQSDAPSDIATRTRDSRCDPILAAPDKVKSWASPCGACGPFGLFDPPYAIPTISATTTVVTVTPVPETTATTETTPSPPPATPSSTVSPQPAPTTTAVVTPTLSTTTTTTTTSSSTTAVIVVPSSSGNASAAPTTIQTAAAATARTGGVMFSMVLIVVAAVVLL